MTHLTDTDVEIIEAPDAIEATQVTFSSEKEQTNSASRLGVVIGGQKVLLQLTDISEVLPVPQLQSVPLTKAWYLGVANVRGNLYSVTDLAQFLNWPALKKNISNRIVLLNSVKTTQAAIVIDAVVGLRSIDAMQIASEQTYAMNALWHESDTRCFSSQLYLDQEKTVWLTLDVDALVQNQQFIQPGIA